jgi:hypothetical protein
VEYEESKQAYFFEKNAPRPGKQKFLRAVFKKRCFLLLRFLPTAVGLLAFGAMAWLYARAPAAYIWILRFVGTFPWVHPFIDSSFMYAMKACWEHGVDIYKAVPCDTDGIPAANARMAYSPLWPRLPFLPDEQAARVPVGVVTDLLWIASLSLLPPARTWREASLMVAAALSTMVCFALERNNIDVWLYLLTVAGVLLLLRGGVLQWAGYGVFLLAGLLKYYPFALFGLALRETPARFWAIAGGCFFALAVFVAIFWRELLESLPNVPAGPPYADLFGISNIPLVIGDSVMTALGLSYHAAAYVVLAARLGLTGLIGLWAWRLANGPGLRESFERMAPGECDWMVAGALVVTGCYVMGQSVSYRGIYLMIVLSGLLVLHRHVSAPEVKAQLRWAVILLIPMMWDGGLRLWIAGGLGALANGGQVALWVFRELAWVNLARVLAAVLLVYAMSTPVGRRWAVR